MKKMDTSDVFSYVVYLARSYMIFLVNYQSSAIVESDGNCLAET
jgi:hypothetical protein